MSDQQTPRVAWTDSFQNQAVAYLWRYPGAMSAHDGHFKPEYLTVSTTGQLATLIQEHFRKNKVVPTKATLEELIRQQHPKLSDEADGRKRKALEQRLTELETMPMTDFEFLGTKIREWIRFVAVRDVVLEAKDGLLRNEYDPELPTKMKAALNTGLIDFDPGHMWREQTVERVREAANPNVDPRVPTGLPHLDAQIGGGIQAGELGVLLALPKHFKSGTMLNFAYSAMRASVGRNVAYITLELSPKLVATRFDLRCSMLTKDHLLSETDSFLERLQQRQEIICGDNELHIKAFATKSCSGDTIRTYIDQMYAQKDVKIDMLIVDYLDLMKSTRQREKDYLEAVDITEDLRSLASKEEYNLPIWTACRATREAVGRRRISMNHMSKAFERVGVADMVLALCMTEEEKVRGEMRIAPVAMRNDAGDKIVDCRVDYPHMALTSVSTSDPDFGDDDEEERKERRKPKGEKGSKRDRDLGDVHTPESF